MLPTTHVVLVRGQNGLRVMLDGEDVTDAIRTARVTRAVSAVSSHAAVREAMVREQRAMGKDGGIVLEGRDIGTVVFPDADLKFLRLLIAAQRRKELAERGETIRSSLWNARLPSGTRAMLPEWSPRCARRTMRSWWTHPI
jgi:cytidylate kinase